MGNPERRPVGRSPGYPRGTPKGRGGGAKAPVPVFNSCADRRTCLGVGDPRFPRRGSRLSEGKCSESTSCLRGARSGYSRDMQYAILRVQKLKSSAAVHRSMKHAFRAQDTPNADPALTPDNTHIGAQNVAEGMAAFRARLPEKFRKDAVQCVEYLMTASPEVMQAKSRDEQDAYFRLLEWLKKRHGSEKT